MSLSFELSIEVSEQYDFNKESLDKIEQNVWVRNQWPLVYFIRNDKIKEAYVGESTNAVGRIKNHLANSQRTRLNKISIIGSDKFNKSATLDIESKLIQYISSEETYNLQNGNYGLINHNYYQQDLYKDLFKEIWKKLIDKNIVTKSLEEIENSELFKYSPYKSLNKDQYNSVLEILNGLTVKNSNRIFISGSAGTGKTVLATYLIKLLYSNINGLNNEDFNTVELLEINYIKAFQTKYPNAKIGLVIAMTSLRESLKDVFRKIPGLKSSMVISPSDTFKIKEKYDLLIIDEAHRLRKYKNIGWLGAFKKNNQKLGLDDKGTELDWILANSKNQIFFYDAAQSVKPSDIDEEKFDTLLNDKNTIRLELVSQMRVKGGNSYIQFIDDLLKVKLKTKEKFSAENYEFIIFDSLKDLYHELKLREASYGLCRLVAGISWEWLSKTEKNAIDIEIEGLKFRWNQTLENWVNSPNAFNEIGCIHTIQGYDLNYTGVIFGKEIIYNNITDEIEIDSENYHDTYGRNGANYEELKYFIINIYKTIMYRGIKGTFVYAHDKNLREYLKRHIPIYEKEIPFRILRYGDVKPYVNAVPLFDISVAAGDFTESHNHSELTWIELPMNITPKQGYFVCKIIGESMNKKIPNGSWCLFQEDPGGSREGKIVLVQYYNIQEAGFGAGFTIKEYHSKKKNSDHSWYHEKIILKPVSNDSKFNDIILKDDELSSLKVVGVFISILTF